MLVVSVVGDDDGVRSRSLYGLRCRRRPACKAQTPYLELECELPSAIVRNGMTHGGSHDLVGDIETLRTERVSTATGNRSELQDLHLKSVGNVVD